ncbi:hypothetical protein EAE99_000630 [Botrytis elliptica]|nr:hypothetical protein EAE99_000630 [Botrytis elliptica]
MAFWISGPAKESGVSLEMTRSISSRRRWSVFGCRTYEVKAVLYHIINQLSAINILAQKPALRHPARRSNVPIYQLLDGVDRDKNTISHSQSPTQKTRRGISPREQNMQKLIPREPHIPHLLVQIGDKGMASNAASPFFLLSSTA